VLGVGDRGCQDIVDDGGGVAFAEAQRLARSVDVLTPDQVEHLPGLVRRHADVSGNRTRPRLPLGRGPAPMGLAGALHGTLVDLLQQVLVDERPLLQAARHSYLRAPRERRRLMMSFWEGLLLSLVRPSGLPHGDTGWRPPEDLPSPPPRGWSTGFMATPRVCG